MGRKNRRPKAVVAAPATPMLSAVRVECERAMKAIIERDDVDLALNILRDALTRFSSHPLIRRALALLYIRKAKSHTNSSVQCDYYYRAVKLAIDAAKSSPSSIELAYFSAIILYEFGGTHGFDFDDVIKECRRGLEIQNPTDPTLDYIFLTETKPEVTTVEARIAHVKLKLQELIEKAKEASASTDGKVKQATKTEEERRKEIEFRVAVARLLQQQSDVSVIKMKDDVPQSPESEPISHMANKVLERRKMADLRKSMASEEKKVQMESYWNSTSYDEKQEFFTVSIPGMRAHYKKDSLASDVVSEALAFFQANKVWTFWECGQCKEKWADCETFMDHVVVEHVGGDWVKYEEVLPQEASNDWVEMVLRSKWKPLDASATMERFMKGHSGDGSNGGSVDDCSSECLGFKDSSNPFRSSPQQANVHLYQALLENDPDRPKLLEKIQGILRLMIKHKYFTSRHSEKMMEFAMGVLPQLTLMSLYSGQTKAPSQNPSFICFLGSQDLQIILRKLELISEECELGISPEEDGSNDNTTLHEDTIPDREVLACDSSIIFLDNRFLPAMLGLTTSVDLPERSEPDAGLLIRWLFSAPTSEEQVLSWTRLREEKAQVFVQTLKLLQMEHYALPYWCEKKIRWSSYEVALCNIRNLFVQEICNSNFVQSVPQSCKTIPKKSQEELVDNDDMSSISCRLELDVISVVLQDARAISVSRHGVPDTLSADLESGQEYDYRIQEYLYQVDEHIKAAIVMRLAQADVELDIIDAMIKKSLAEVQQLKDKIKSVSALSYGKVVTPLVKSFLRIHLEDLVERDANEKSDAALRATLEEFNEDTNRNADKRGDRSNKSKVKPKNKKKNKDNRKVKEPKVVARKALLHDEITESSPVSATDCIHVQSESNGSADDLDQQEELRHKLEFEEDKRLKEILEYQRHFENEAKKKLLMERSRMDIEMVPKNAVEEQVSVVSDLNRDLAHTHCSSYSSAQAVTAVPTQPQGIICSADDLDQLEELRHKLEFEEDKLKEILENESHIEIEAKQKLLMERTWTDIETVPQNVIEEQGSVVSDLNIDLAQTHCSSYSSTQAVTAVPTQPQGIVYSADDLDQQEELRHELESEEDKKLEEILECQSHFESEAKQKLVMERSRMVIEMVPQNVIEQQGYVVSDLNRDLAQTHCSSYSSPQAVTTVPTHPQGIVCSAHDLDQEEELRHKLEFEEDKSLKEIPEYQSRFENDAKQKLLMERSRMDIKTVPKNVVEEQASVVSDLNIDLARTYCSSYSSPQAVTVVPPQLQGIVCSYPQAVIPDHTHPQTNNSSLLVFDPTPPDQQDRFDFYDPAVQALSSTQDISEGLVFGCSEPVPIVFSVSEILKPKCPQGTHSTQFESRTDRVEYGTSINELTSDTSIEKYKLGTGLKNEAGENNCFLNVVIQSLWHLRRFRHEFLGISHSSLHKCVGIPCVLCSLHAVFTDLSEASEVHSEVVDPKRLRVSLSKLAANGNILQEEQMDDASEVLGVILKSLHQAVASAPELDAETVGTMSIIDLLECKKNNCISHRLFETKIYAKVNSGEARQIMYSSFFHYVNARELREMKVLHTGSSFDELLKLMEMKSLLERDLDHGRHRFMDCVYGSLCIWPHILTVVLGWQKANESANDISATLAAITTDINIGGIYFGSERGNKHNLVSVVCFHGCHFLCFIYRFEHGKWFMYDDETVRVIGNWDDVLDACAKGCLQPQVLFFERTLKIRVEDLVEQDTKEKSDAASRAIYKELNKVLAYNELLHEEITEGAAIAAIDCIHIQSELGSADDLGQQGELRHKLDVWEEKKFEERMEHQMTIELEGIFYGLDQEGEYRCKLAMEEEKDIEEAMEHQGSAQLEVCASDADLNQEGVLQHELETEEEEKLEDAVECQRHIENEAKQKLFMELSRTDIGKKNVVADQGSVISSLGVDHRQPQDSAHSDPQAAMRGQDYVPPQAIIDSHPQPVLAGNTQRLSLFHSDLQAVSVGHTELLHSFDSSYGQAVTSDQGYAYVQPQVSVYNCLQDITAGYIPSWGSSYIPSQALMDGQGYAYAQPQGNFYNCSQDGTAWYIPPWGSSYILPHVVTDDQGYAYEQRRDSFYYYPQHGTTGYISPWGSSYTQAVMDSQGYAYAQPWGSFYNCPQDATIAQIPSWSSSYIPPQAIIGSHGDAYLWPQGSFYNYPQDIMATHIPPWGNFPISPQADIVSQVYMYPRDSFYYSSHDVAAGYIPRWDSAPIPPQAVMVSQDYMLRADGAWPDRSACDLDATDRRRPTQVASRGQHAHGTQTSKRQPAMTRWPAGATNGQA